MSPMDADMLIILDALEQGFVKATEFIEADARDCSNRLNAAGEIEHTSDCGCNALIALSAYDDGRAQFRAALKALRARLD